MMHKIFVGALGFVASVAATPLELAERNSCRDDSLYTCFADRQYASSASAYCSGLTPSTQTVTAVNPTITTTVWQTSTAATATDFISSTTTVYTATVPSSTEIATSTETDTVTVTATVTAGSSPTQAPLKRGAQGGKAQPPRCMITKCFVYSPDRITAACRCIGVPPQTVTVTQAADSTTITVTSTSTTTPSITAVAWQTVVTELADGVSTTTTTVTATATTTSTVTVIPRPSNIIPNGDFSSGVNGWSVINSFPSAWINSGVSTANSPDGASNDLHVTNVANTGQFFIASPTFGVQGSSTYTLSFLISNTATDTSWLTRAIAQLNCGSFTLASPIVSRATQGPNSYWISTTNFNTPTATDPTTLGQLGRCQAQILYTPGTATPNTWFLADVSVAYVGRIATAP